MTHKENITAILECFFPGHKEEIIEGACNRILEQESCEDLLSTVRRLCKAKGLEFFFAVPTASEWSISECEHLRQVAKYHKELELAGGDEVSNETGWIPVSERLPKIADVYRVTRYYPKNVMNPKYIVDACAFDGSNTWYNDNRINNSRIYADNVIAWQENPEPYNPEREDVE